MKCFLIQAGTEIKRSAGLAKTIRCLYIGWDTESCIRWGVHKASTRSAYPKHHLLELRRKLAHSHYSSIVHAGCLGSVKAPVPVQSHHCLVPCCLQGTNQPSASSCSHIPSPASPEMHQRTTEHKMFPYRFWVCALPSNLHYPYPFPLCMACPCCSGFYLCKPSFGKALLKINPFDNNRILFFPFLSEPPLHCQWFNRAK